MARQVQIIKGTTEQNDAFTGAEGALTYDTETKNLRIHDGTTEGGFEIPSSAMGDYVIYWDSADSTDHSHAKPGVSTPTDHGWYRYYKSGWVEQGGVTATVGAGTGIPVTLQVVMAGTNYCIFTQTVRVNTNDPWYDAWLTNITTAAFTLTPNRDGSGTDTAYAYWEVKGYAA